MRLTSQEKKIEAVREIEDIEDELHDEGHELADSLSMARIKLNSALLVEAIGDYREDEEHHRGQRDQI